MNLSIDKEKYLVAKDDVQFILTKKEFEILLLLCTIPGKVYSRKIIFEAVWGKSKSKERTVDVHILNIRKKLDESIITTIKSVGYKISTLNTIISII